MAASSDAVQRVHASATAATSRTMSPELSRPSSGAIDGIRCRILKGAASTGLGRTSTIALMTVSDRGSHARMKLRTACLPLAFSSSRLGIDIPSFAHILRSSGAALSSAWASEYAL